MLFGQFRETWIARNDEVRFRFKSLIDDLLKTQKKGLTPDTQKLLSEIIGRVNEVRSRFEGNNSIIRDCLENLERDVLETLGKEQ